MLEFPPSIAYGRLYFAQQRGRFFAIHHRTGKVVWQRRFNHCSAASPTIAYRVVYHSWMQPLPCNRFPRNQPGQVVAMAARTGKIVWRYPRACSSPHRWWLGRRSTSARGTTSSMRSTSTPARPAGRSPPTPRSTARRRSRTGRSISERTAAASTRWTPARGAFAGALKRSPASGAASSSTPRRRLRTAACSSGTRTARLRLRRLQRTLLWAQRAGNYIYTAAAVWRQRVYVGTYDGQFMAFNAATGDRLWRFQASSAIHGAPSVIDGLVYFAACPRCGRNASRSSRSGDRGTYALNALTGKLVWRWPDGVFSPAIADSQHLYIVGRSRVFSFAPKNRRALRRQARRQRARRSEARSSTSSGKRGQGRAGRRSTPQTPPRRSTTGASATASTKPRRNR